LLLGYHWECLLRLKKVHGWIHHRFLQALSAYQLLHFLWESSSDSLEKCIVGALNSNKGFSELNKSLARVTTSITTASFAAASVYTFKKLSDRSDCLSWAIEQLSKAGVHFKLPLSIITPNGAVEYLNLHVKAVVLKDS